MVYRSCPIDGLFSVDVNIFYLCLYFAWVDCPKHATQPNYVIKIYVIPTTLILNLEQIKYIILIK